MTKNSILLDLLWSMFFCFFLQEISNWKREQKNKILLFSQILHVKKLFVAFKYTTIYSFTFIYCLL